MDIGDVLEAVRRVWCPLHMAHGTHCLRTGAWLVSNPTIGALTQRVKLVVNAAPAMTEF